MIGDSSVVALVDGSSKLAIDVVPGTVVASVKYRRGVVVKGRKIANREAVVTLMLSTGRTLTGTREQLVYRCSKRAREMSDLEIGDRLMGFKNGMKTTVRVTGVSYHDSATRLVALELDQPFIAEGLVCHS